jgi:hypothetical protein
MLHPNPVKQLLTIELSMIVIAVLALTIFHPGFYFPQLAGRKWEKPSVELDSLDESDVALRERNIRGEPKSVQVSTIGE